MDSDELLLAVLSEAEAAGHDITEVVGFMGYLVYDELHIWEEATPMAVRLERLVGDGWTVTADDHTDFVLSFFGGYPPVDDDETFAAPAA